MDDPVFSISLGNGLYMDSTGAIHTGPVENKPVYQAPGGGLPIKTDPIQKAFEGFAKGMPDSSDPDKYQKIREKLGRLGVPDKTIELMAKLGEYAATAATIVSVVGIALDLAKAVGLFKDGPDPMQALLDQFAVEMKAWFQAGEQQTRWTYIGDRRDRLDNALALVHDYAQELKNLYPNATRLQQIHSQMEASINGPMGVAEGIRNLLRFDTWLKIFNPDDYKITWFSVRSWLYNFPPGAPPTSVPFPPSGVNLFDHRWMAPAILYCLEGYLTLIKAIQPEYRSTGAFSSMLHDFANLLEDRAKDMRANTLARTFYKANDIVHTQPSMYGPTPMLLGAGLYVGAVDLCVDTDQYLTRPDLVTAAEASPEPGRRATVNFHWTPPPGTKPGIWPVNSAEPWILSTEEADAANAQSEKDFADLLFSSGYLSIVHLATTLRHLSIEPDRSETVTGRVTSYRQPQASSETTARSEKIPFSPVIERPAKLVPQKYEVYAWLTMQPANRPVMLPYRVLLRAVPIKSYALRDTPYEEMYWADYVPDPADARFKKLVTTILPLPGREAVLIQGQAPEHPQTSPQELIQKSGVVSLQADTFDWYIPVKAPHVTGSLGDMQMSLQALRMAGWTQPSGSGRAQPLPNNVPMPAPYPPPSAAPIFLQADAPILDLLGSEDGAQNWKGKRYHKDTREIQIEYNLEWKSDRLSVLLKNRPEDRNYMIYLVVEEGLASGQLLHTAFPIAMNGQLTYVPQEFFDEEQKAIDHAGKIFHKFETDYALSQQPKVGDPVMSKLALRALSSDMNLPDLEAELRQAHPELIRQAEQAVQARVHANRV